MSFAQEDQRQIEYLITHMRYFSKSAPKKKLLLRVKQLKSDIVCELENTFQNKKVYVYRLWEINPGRKVELCIEVLSKFENDSEVLNYKLCQSNLLFPYSHAVQELRFDSAQLNDSAQIVMQFQIQSHLQIVRSLSPNQLEILNKSLEENMRQYKKENELHQQLVAYTNSLIRDLSMENKPYLQESYVKRPIYPEPVPMAATNNIYSENISTNRSAQTASLEKIKQRRQSYINSVDQSIIEEKQSNRQTDNVQQLDSSNNADTPHLLKKPWMLGDPNQSIFSKANSYKFVPTQSNVAESNVAGQNLTQSQSSGVKLNIITKQRRKGRPLTLAQSLHLQKQDMSIQDPFKIQMSERSLQQPEKKITPFKSKTAELVSFRIQNIRSKIYHSELSLGKLVQIKLEDYTYTTNVLISEETTFQWSLTDYCFNDVCIDSDMIFKVVTCDDDGKRLVGETHVKVSDFHEFKDALGYKIFLSLRNAVVGYIQFDFKFENYPKKSSRKQHDRSFTLPKIKQNNLPSPSLAPNSRSSFIRVKSENHAHQEKEKDKNRSKSKKRRSKKNIQYYDQTQKIKNAKDCEEGKRSCICRLKRRKLEIKSKVRKN